MPVIVQDWGSKNRPLIYIGKKTNTPIAINWPPPSEHENSSVDKRLVEYAGGILHGNLGFYGYLRICDALIARRCCVVLADMVDYMWLDAYNDEVPPEESVRSLLEEEGTEEEIDA